MQEIASIELKILRDISAADGVEAASTEATGRIQAGLTFLGETIGKTAVKQLVIALLDGDMPEAIALARPPEFWSERFAERGIELSARWLREKAIAAGLCYYVDRKVLLTPAHVDALFAWRGSSSKRATIGPEARASRRLADKEFQKARARLEKAKADRSAKNKKKMQDKPRT